MWIGSITRRRAAGVRSSRRLSSLSPATYRAEGGAEHPRGYFIDLEGYPVDDVARELVVVGRSAGTPPSWLRHRARNSPTQPPFSPSRATRFPVVGRCMVLPRARAHSPMRSS